MSEQFDFLVIITTFRRPEQLRACIESVVNQPETSKLVVVVDDCPNGSAKAVVEQFSRILYLQTPQASGGWPGRVRNYAFKYLQDTGIESHYVHFLDDDDTAPPDHYEHVRDAMLRNPHVGVVFGVMRPFCRMSMDPMRREQQIHQMWEIRKWREQATRFPWLYQDLANRMPHVSRWLFRQHATFGAEMFLCSAGVIRTDHVRALGGFPDVRITQDYEFYTEAIRRYGCIFLQRETAGYGTGNENAIWNPLVFEDKTAHSEEWNQELFRRFQGIRQQMGSMRFYFWRSMFKGQTLLLNGVVIPLLDRRGHFVKLYEILDGRPDVQQPRQAVSATIRELQQ